MVLSYQKALSYLTRLEKFGMRLDLTRMRRHLAAWGDPHKAFPIIHIAGTNGKGSVSAMLATILSEAGYRTGHYTSPHLVDVRERIRVNGVMISKPLFARLLLHCQSFQTPFTHFEALTAVAFKYFERQQVDVAVLETGLGGRWDATNIAERVTLSVITTIGWDHMDRLGNTLEKIAWEKAGIIKPGVPVVCGVEQRNLRRLVARQAKALGSVVHFVNAKNIQRSTVSWAQGWQQYWSPSWRNLRISLLGSYQRLNLAIVLRVINLLRAQGMTVPSVAVRRGLLKTQWNGRFQVLQIPDAKSPSKIPVILDGAHNREGFQALAESLKASPYGRKPYVLLAALLKDKDPKPLARYLGSGARTIIATQPNSNRAIPGTALAQKMRSLQKGKVILSIPKFKNAWKSALAHRRQGESLVVTGSLYLIGEALQKLRKVLPKVIAPILLLLPLLGESAGAQVLEGVARSTEPYHITADYLEFQDDTHQILGRGHVVITQRDAELRADEVSIDTKTQKISLQGQASIKNASGTLKGDRLIYDIGSKKGSISGDVVITSPPYFFKAKSLSKTGEKTYRMKQASFTACDQKQPHYHVTAGRLKLVEGKEFVATNVVVYLGHVPLFYWPVYRKDLDTLYTLEVTPAYSQTQGYSFKTTHGYPLGHYGHGKAFVDYISRRGWGTGGEINYDKSDQMRGTVYGYHIKERVTELERWTGRVDHWQRLTSQLSTQATGRFQSDTQFNNEFFQDADQRVASDLRTSAALVYQPKYFTSRLLYQYDQVFDPAAGDYTTDVRKAPELQWATTALRIPGTRVIATAQGALGNQFLRTEGFNKPVGQAGLSLSRDWRLSKKTTLNPSLILEESWADKTSATDDSDFYQMRYGSNVNLRRRINRWTDLDLTHQYRRRLAPNRWEDDSSALDKGIDLHRVGFLGHLRPNRSVRFRVFSGYDITRDRGENIDDFRQKLEPLSGELSVSVASRLTLFVRNNYKIYEHHVQSFLSDADINLTKGVSLKLGFSYEESTPGVYQLKNGISLPLGHKWWFEVLLRYHLANSGGLDLHGLEFVDKEINLRRDFHDFIGRFRYLERAGVRQITLRIDFRTDVLKRKELYKNEIEQEFYPWRTDPLKQDR